MGSNAEQHGEDTVAHKAKVPPSPTLPVLRHRLLCTSLMKLLPVTCVVHAGGKGVGEKRGRDVTPVKNSLR